MSDTGKTLADIIKEHEDIRQEIAYLKQLVSNAGDDAHRAHERIDKLEARMEEVGKLLSRLSSEVHRVRAVVDKFDQKQDTFLANTWKLIFNLLVIIGGFVVILGGLVGVKLAF